MRPRDPFYRSSTFWTHVATSAAGLTTAMTGMFDPNFILHHPAVSAIMVISGMILTGVSQAAYSISRAIRPLPVDTTQG